MINRWTTTLKALGVERWKLTFFHRTEAARRWTDSVAAEPRASDTWTCRVRLFRDFFERRRKWTGELGLELDANLDADEIRSLLAARLDELGRDPWPWYPMHQGPTGPGLTQQSSLAKKPSLDSWLEPLSQAFFSAADRATALEVRTVCLETLYLDSLGRQMEHVGHWCELSAEDRYHTLTLRHGEYMPERIAHKAAHFQEEASLLATASRWESGPPQLLLLGGELPGLLFHYVLRQLDGAALYAGDSTLQVGRPLFEAPEGDVITLRTLVRLYNSPYSRWFDEDGVMIKELELVRDGTVRAFTASQREGHLLGLPVTGHPVNFSVGPGSLDEDGLRQESYLEVYRWEDWTLDESTGAFSASIPYAVGSQGEGRSRQAFRGLRLRGNLRELLATSRWTTAIAQRTFFEGPEFLAISPRFLAFS